MDWPSYLDPPLSVITSIGRHTPVYAAAHQVTASTPTSTTWPAASRAIYMPFTIGTPRTATLIGWENGAAVSGTMYVGLYDENKALLVTANAAQSGTSTFQSIDIADTLLPPGTYYIGAALDNATGAVMRVPSVPFLLSEICGIQQQASATPLPNPAVFANPASAFMPIFSVATTGTF